MLWIVTGANICSLIRSIRFQKKWSKTYNELFSELQESIDDAKRAESRFLEAAETYHTMCRELQEDENDG
jgi:hypothetical protein